MGGEDQILSFKLKFGAFTVELRSCILARNMQYMLKNNTMGFFLLLKSYTLMINGIFGRGHTNVQKSNVCGGIL